VTKTLHCRDLGFDCDHVVEGESEESVLEQAAAHAKSEHGLDEIPDEVVEKALTLIRESP
jgi:predicted small metal-binding protein